MQDCKELQRVVVDQYDQSVYASGAIWSGEGTGIFRSTNCGSTWNLVSTGQSSSKLATGIHWAMIIDPHPNAPPTFYVAIGYGTDPTIY